MSFQIICEECGSKRVDLRFYNCDDGCTIICDCCDNRLDGYDYNQRESKPKLSGKTVNVTLGELVTSDDACSHFGLNPWCVNEGAPSSEEYRVPIELAKEWGMV